MNQDLSSFILDDPVLGRDDRKVDQRRPDSAKRVVDDDFLGTSLDIFGNFTLADVQQGAEGYSGSLGQVFDGRVKPEVVVVGHVLLLGAGDGVVVLGHGYSSVESLCGAQ